MPRKITENITFDDLEDEVLYTRAALKADPDAAGLLPSTDNWFTWVDQARAESRKAREAKADTDAARVVANARLDQLCIEFGDKLFMAVKKDRNATRWTQFFRQPVSRFIRQPLIEQVNTVKAWLTTSDGLVTEMRAELERWIKAAEQALLNTEATSAVRGKAWVVREKLAEDFTRARDGLYSALAEISRQKNLPRDWPDLFFRTKTVTRVSSSNETESATNPTTTADTTA